MHSPQQPMGAAMSRTLLLASSAALLLHPGCKRPDGGQHRNPPPASYYDNNSHPDAWSGGAHKITISTPKGPHQVWIRRIGNNPRLKLLLLTGGPGLSHAYLEVMDSYLPADGIEYYHYDQFGPAIATSRTIPTYGRSRATSTRSTRFAEPGGNKSNFCLLGHSWGGLLAIEYALAHQDQMKCLVISNMMASIPAYNAYAKNVLEPADEPGCA